MADKWIWGCVNGVDGSTHSGSGFRAERKDVGRYEITYVEQFSETPAVVITQNYPEWTNFVSGGGDPRDNSVLIASDRTHFKIRTGSAAGESSDRNFTFIAIGTVT